jgi:signal transduction histidine kinase
MGASDPTRVAFETARLELARLRVSLDGREIALQGALRLCARTLKVDRVGFWQFAPDQHALQAVLGYTLSTDEWSAGDVVTESRHPTYWAALQGRRVIAAHDATSDPITAELTASYLAPLGIGSLLDAPVFRAGDVVGVICFEHVGQPRTWTSDELTFATSAADLVAMVLEQADRLAFQEQLRLRTGKLIVAEKLEVLESLARGLAHDFSNILLAVELVGSLLAQRGDSESATSLRSCAEVGGNLVGQLRRFGNRGSDLLPHMPVRTVIERLVPIVVTLVRDTASLAVDIDDLDPATVATISPSQLEQIILNLCLNARDAIEAPGTIRLSARTTDDHIELSVRDDGCGIAPEIATRIWEPYFTTKDHGTGLGLATVRTIVDEVGGDIDVESGPDRGTTFVIRLRSA